MSLKIPNEFKTFLLKLPSSFLLNRDDNSTPSFLSSLKVLLCHHKYIIPKTKESYPSFFTK